MTCKQVLTSSHNSLLKETIFSIRFLSLVLREKLIRGTEQVDGSIPLYRFFNTETGTHFYTAAEAEKDSIIREPANF